MHPLVVFTVYQLVYVEWSRTLGLKEECAFYGIFRHRRLPHWFPLPQIQCPTACLFGKSNSELTSTIANTHHLVYNTR